MESGFRVERTKYGAGDKQEAIIVESQKAKSYAFFVLAAFAMITIVAADYKFELVSMAVRQRALFKLKEINRVAEHAAQARLVRLGSALESHLERDQQQMQMLDILGKRQAKLMSEHEAEVRKIASNKGLDKAEMQAALDLSTRTFHKSLRQMVSRHTKYIAEEGRVAEQRLNDLHKEIMSELETEVLEDSFNRDPKSASDTKALMEASKTQIEQLKHMLHNFEHKVRRIEQVALSPKKMKEWQKLLEDTRSGAVDFEVGEKKMLELMNAAAVGALSKSRSDQNNVMENFETMLHEVKFSPVKRQLLDEMRGWETGKISVQEVLLDIQRRIKRGEVDSSWFMPERSEPRTQRERDNADHDHIGAQVSGLLEAADKHKLAPPPVHDT